MKSYLLSEKVQLWRRQIVDTVDGDVAERWSHDATVWADVRLKGTDGDSLLLDIRMRPHGYKVDRIYWHGVWADCPKSIYKTRDYVRFFAKSRTVLTAS